MTPNQRSLFPDVERREDVRQALIDFLHGRRRRLPPYLPVFPAATAGGVEPAGGGAGTGGPNRPEEA